MSSIGDAVIATDTMGQITFLNSVAQALTGWSENEAVGAPLQEVFQIINEDTRQSVENPVTRALRENTVVELANHTLLIRKDGSEISIGDSAAPIRNAAGEVTGVVLVFRDVSEQRRAEIAVRDAKQYAENITERKKLEDNLRQLAADLSDDPTQSEATRHMMEVQVQQMVRLIDDLLDVSRITQGKLVLRKSRVNLAEVVTNAV